MLGAQSKVSRVCYACKGQVLRLEGWTGKFYDRLHISTRQYARLLKDWVKSTGLEPRAYGTHSMHRTKVAQFYKKTGNLRAVQLLLRHTKMDSTVRYLGVDLEDALAMSESVET